MDIAALGAKIAAARGYVAGGIAIGAAYLVVSSFVKLPAKVDQHMQQADSAQATMEQTNKKLDVLICLQAKLDTPIRCVARGH